ncbi:hypothetical protein BDZ85DRAFT_256807 [Elsinoe ampelina]|uniref:Uncharacterized protein n=1 Tax=Elsinoe ampelina TaxID=302913 RepID=A0A6A6GMC1_9PEZI|nr:hypothetical protein BDZ85DRAFT_256807 [Elsinoe ampelina]
MGTRSPSYVQPIFVSRRPPTGFSLVVAGTVSPVFALPLADAKFTFHFSSDAWLWAEYWRREQ